MGQAGGSTTKVGPDGLADDLVSAQTGRWTDLDLGSLLRWDVDAQGWVGESEGQSGSTAAGADTEGQTGHDEAGNGDDQVDGDEASIGTAQRGNDHGTGEGDHEEQENHRTSYNDEEGDFTDVTSSTASPVAVRTEDHWR